MMTIEYTDKIVHITPDSLKGFFVGWPNPPDEKLHLEILRNSYKVWLAMDGTRCIGFINALSDGIFYAFIPLLEVLPEYRRNGIGTELVKRMVQFLDKMYAIDIVCDESVAPFYQKIGFNKCVGLIKRNCQGIIPGVKNCKIDTDEFTTQIDNFYRDKNIPLLTDTTLKEFKERGRL